MLTSDGYKARHILRIQGSESLPVSIPLLQSLGTLSLCSVLVRRVYICVSTPSVWVNCVGLAATVGNDESTRCLASEIVSGFISPLLNLSCLSSFALCIYLHQMGSCKTAYCKRSCRNWKLLKSLTTSHSTCASSSSSSRR